MSDCDGTKFHAPSLPLAAHKLLITATYYWFQKVTSNNMHFVTILLINDTQQHI